MMLTSTESHLQSSNDNSAKSPMEHQSLPYASSARRTARYKRILPQSFTPLASSVIIGKGKMPAQASGNHRLRYLVDMLVADYANARFKSEKTFIVTRVMQAVQSVCPGGGGFVKYHSDRWWEVPDSVAREKIACMFRDSLSGMYKSSNKNKVERRRAKKALKVKAQENKTESANSNYEAITSLIDQGLELIPPIESNGFMELSEMFESVDETIFDDVSCPKAI
eukprot:scaffold4705_cov108-Cylindrotheca_fusiformis.AAC.6